MRILVTGVTGYVGAALVPRLPARRPRSSAASARAAHRVTRHPSTAFVEGDVDQRAPAWRRALDGVEVAYYLIHSMERASNGGYDAHERAPPRRFAAAATARRACAA